MSLNPLQALQEQQRSAENLFIASGSTGLVCLATGAVSAFLVKTNRLSCANFRRLTGVVGAVFLAALYCGRKAFQQMTEIQKTRSETAEKQRLFDRAFPAASKHISKMFSAMEKPLFEGSTDAVTLKTITDALTENRNLAQALNAFSALDTSNGLKAFFLEHAIKGRDLSSEQRMLVLNFFKDLCSNNRYSMLQLMRAWPGDVPKALQTSPAAIGIIKGQPWLCEGGAFDLIAGLFTKQGEELYTFLGSNVSTEGWDAFLHPTSADPISVLGAQAHRAEQHFRASCCVGLLCLATGAVSVFMVKTDRLSCANFRRLIGGVILVALAALYYGKSASERAHQCHQDLSLYTTQRKQELFQKALFVAHDYIVRTVGNAFTILFENSGDLDAVDGIKEALVKGQKLASRTILPGPVSVAFKAVLEEHDITGDDLTADQKRELLNFFKELCQKQNRSIARFMEVWPDNMSGADGITPAWSRKGGVFDLIASLSHIKDRQTLYNGLAATFDQSWEDYFFAPERI